MLSGALGLGGSSIFNPILLELGLPPAVSSATSMYMVIYSTASSSFVYFLYDLLDVYYGLWLGALCTMSVMVGILILTNVLKKFNRQSPIVFILSLVLFISAVTVTVSGAF